ncbi:MAG TPA: TMEM165/GDT1 family protein [Allosphingosinicella sp.]|nr:TMEM165/GDT1 family protein [Allosphingosinicella sp.]
MEPLLTSFVAAALAEWGAKTQLLVILLAARYRKPLPILLGIALAAIANSLIAAYAGWLIHDRVPLRALALLTALALLFAGAEGLFPARLKPMAEGWRTGPFVTTACCFFLLEFADRTQFVTAAIAARFDTIALAGAGAAAGILIASVPAAALGERLAKIVPVRVLRIAAALLFLIAAFIVAINALRLV